MTRALIISFMLAAYAAGLSAQSGICDMQSAREWCDDTMLRRVEGIWEYPDDETSVVIKRSATQKGHYDIIVVESADTRVSPGECIGYLVESPDPTAFEMGLFRSKRNGLLAELGKCLARLGDNDSSILVKGRKLRFSIASRWLLPSFWKLIKVSLKDPLESLPKGMVRIYPETSPRQPDYL